MSRGPGQSRLSAQGKIPFLPSASAAWIANAGPRGILITTEQEKHGRVDAASILEEALKGYQVAAQTIARFIAEKFLCEDRQLHVKQIKCLHRAAGG